MKDKKLRNRTRGLLLLATSSLFLSSCGKPTNSASVSSKVDSLSSSSVVTAQAKIWSAYNTENLMQDNAYDLTRVAALSFDAAKGEGESAQLMVSANEKISSFSFFMGKVSDGAGHSIAVQNFNENLSILMMTGLYYMMVKIDLSIYWVITLFGLFVSTSMLLVKRRHEANQRERNDQQHHERPAALIAQGA